MSVRFLVVGEALVDLVDDGDGVVRELPGGSPANVALTLGRLGADVTLETVLADDARGVAVRERLEEAGVVVRRHPPASGRTSTASVVLDDAGAATYEFDLSWDPATTDVAGADVLHVGSVAAVLAPGADTVRDAVRRARSRAVVSFDPNVRPVLVDDAAAVRARTDELVALADVVKVSDEDLAWLAPGTEVQETARRWASWGPGLVVVTRGSEGALVVRPDGGVAEVPGRRVDVVDTVGAGDTFTAALLDELAAAGVHGPQGDRRLRSLSDAALRRAVTVAAAAASVTVSRAGANPPDRAELTAAVGPVVPVPLPGGPVLGMTWGWTGVRGTWATDAAQASLDAMVDSLATTWTAVTYAAVQETAQSTRIPFREAPALTDDEVRWAVRAAKARGQKVCLKPVVNVADGTWRAHIGFLHPAVPNEPSWDQWFASYTEFVVHHARIAAEEGAEMFCVGCEMVGADPHADSWRAVIAAVREVYGGLVTYNCDKYQEDRLTWWDAVDVISASGYYPLGGWEAQLDRVERVVAREGKPFFFMETGCPSRTGSAALPNDWTLEGPPDAREQARWYADMLAATTARPWVQGWVLWDWPPVLYAADEAVADDDYCPYGKPAAAEIASVYRRLAGEGAA